MTVPQKAALSLLIAVVVSAAVSVLAFTGFFNLIETRFYNPSVTRAQVREAERDAGVIEAFLGELEGAFAGTLDNDAVRRSFLPNQSAQDIFERTRLYGLLLESRKGLQSVRFVDMGGLRLHYSTNSADILSQDAGRIAYKNYADTAPFIPYDLVAVGEQGKPKLTLDQNNDRLVFSFPFYDSMEVYRGTALYSLSVRAVADILVSEGRLKVGEDLSLVSQPAGFVSSLPASGKAPLLNLISSIWSEGLLGLAALDSANSPSALALVSAKTSGGLFVARVIDEKVFAFPLAMKIILLLALFLTLYLTIFLLFNLRADKMTVIQNRLKRLELSLISEYYDKKGDVDWDRWYRELQSRREDVRAELKRGIKAKDESALMQDIDSLIDKSWDEIILAIGGRRETRLAIDEDKLQSLLNRALAVVGTAPAGAQTVAATQAPAQKVVTTAPSAPAAKPAAAPAADDVEELGEEVEELGEEVEELGEEVEELGEEVEELGEEVEELGEEVEELGDEVEELGEEVAEAEAVEELGGADDIEELADADEIEELGGADEPAKSPDPIASLDEAVVVDAGPASKGEPAKSNVKLIFGDDDIPVIMESSGLELVDDDIDTLMKPEGADEPEELEELGSDGLEPLEELDEAERVEDDVPHSPEEGAHGPTMEDIASQIEFGESKVEEKGLDSELEIVSPFSSMLSNFDKEADDAAADDKTEEAPTKTSGRLEELAGEGMSLIYKPFQVEETSSPEVIDADGPAGVIQEKDGVNFVADEVKNPDSKTEKALDPGLKNLVNSVIKK